MERRGLNFRKNFLRVFLPIFRALPLPVASRFVSGIGRIEYRWSKSLRTSFHNAVSSGQSMLECDWDVPTVSRELAGNHVLWRTRDLLLDGVPDERAKDMFRVTGRDNIDAAIGLGRGCIVLASHFGAHLLPAHWLFRENFPVRFYMERPRHISRYMARHFDTSGPLGQDKLFISRQGVPADSASSILRATRAIKAGMLLYLAGDVRWTGQLTDSAQFLGRTMRFSTTWVALAAMTEAPVVMVFCRMEPDGRYHLEFRKSFQIPKDVAARGEVGRWVQHFMDTLEQQVRRYPANSNDYFFWEELSGLVA
jgi:phosphatidylinositol dimannoside acyltransferase